MLRRAPEGMSEASAAPTVLPSSRSTRAIFTVASSCNQNAETIGDARPGNVATFGRDLAQTEISDKTAQVQSESAHLSLDGEALYGSYRVKFDLQKGSLSKLASSRRKRHTCWRLQPRQDCSGGASSSAPSDLAGAQPVRSVTARLKSNDSVDDLRTPVVARPFCYPPRLSGSGISISFSAASVMNFRWPATLGFEKYASSGWLAPSYTTTSSKSKGLKPDRQATLTPY